MLPLEIASQTIVRLRGEAQTDTHSNSYVDWSDPDPLTIQGCSVQPLAGEEYDLGRDSVTSRWTLYAPPDADLRSNDRVRHDGVDYDIDGSVQKWPDPTGSGLAHLQALLKRVEG